MKVRPATPGDRDIWVAMRCRLWPEGADDHPVEVDEWYAGERMEPIAVLIAEEAGEALGFVELSIRAYAQGCDSQGVAYVEGWYVEPAARSRGVGRALIEASERWARGRGCSELASDAEADNEASIAAHQACGFRDAGLIRCFAKVL